MGDLGKFPQIVYNVGKLNLGDTPKKPFVNMKKILIFAIILIIAAGIYLNRAYAHIYWTLGAAKLDLIDNQAQYFINSANQANDMETANIVYSALGDSLTAGAGAGDYKLALPYLLAEKMAGGEKTVILNNHSVPGIETSDIITDHLEATLSDNPDVITVLIGVNDIHNKVSVDKFRQNYEAILSRLKQGTKAEIYVINLPFIGADSLMLPPYQRLFDAKTLEFNEIIKELAAKYSIKYIDLYTPTVELFKRSGDHYSKDLFHPSAKGYQIWADLIYADINK